MRDKDVEELLRAHLPFARPPDKNKSRSPLFDDPEIPRKVALAQTSEFPTV